MYPNSSFIKRHLCLYVLVNISPILTFFLQQMISIHLCRRKVSGKWNFTEAQSGYFFLKYFLNRARNVLCFLSTPASILSKAHIVTISHLASLWSTPIISHAVFSLAAAKSLQSCPTLCDPIGGSPSGSPVPGILQARTLEWVAISFSNA